MTRVAAYWAETLVKPSKCPLGLGFCYHDEMPTCRHYYGTTKSVVDLYIGLVKINCSAPMTKGKTK